MIDRLDLHALADGQLSGEAKAQTEAQIGSDLALRNEFEAIRALKGTIAKIEPQTCARTWERCRQRVGELDKRLKAENFVSRYSWGLCSMFALAILGGALLNRSASPGIGTGDAARMISGLAPFSRSAEGAPEKMSDWVVKPRGSEVRLLDRRAGLSYGHPVQKLVFEDAIGKFVVLAVGGVDKVEGVEPMMENPAYSAGKINGTNCVTWPTGDNTMFLVAERPYEELTTLADRLRSEN